MAEPPDSVPPAVAAACAGLGALFAVASDPPSLIRIDTQLVPRDSRIPAHPTDLHRNRFSSIFTNFSLAVSPRRARG